MICSILQFTLFQSHMSFTCFRICFLSLLLIVSMGLGYDSAPAAASSMPATTNPPAAATTPQAKTNALIMQKIQALVAANPSFLTSGIPNHVLAQLFMQPMKVE